MNSEPDRENPFAAPQGLREITKPDDASALGPRALLPWFCTVGVVAGISSGVAIHLTGFGWYTIGVPFGVLVPVAAWAGGRPFPSFQIGLFFVASVVGPLLAQHVSFGYLVGQISVTACLALPVTIVYLAVGIARRPGRFIVSSILASALVGIAWELVPDIRRVLVGFTRHTWVVLPIQLTIWYTTFAAILSVHTK